MATRCAKQRDRSSAPGDCHRLIVLIALAVFELSFYADLLAVDEDPLAVGLISRHALRSIALGAVAAALAAVVAAWVAGARVLQPLITIVNAAAQLARGGDFGKRLKTDTRDGEVFKLTQTFNELVARVDGVLTAQRQLLADTSHELRTPLTTVRGNLELLERDLPAEERADILAESREEVDRMARLVRDLLLLAESDGNVGGAAPRAGVDSARSAGARSGRPRVAGADARGWRSTRSR